jgi:Pyruvate phosphate dikinase, AMP/ATP-binding domain
MVDAGPPEFFPIQPGAALADGGAAQVGNKAWNLMRMAQAGLPVPPAFVLPTAWCRRTGPADAAALRLALARGVAGLEAAAGLGFGAARRPLLVSVRSGAAVSMPGMMETVLDVGLNAGTVEALVRHTGNPRLAWDSYRRLVQGYAEVVGGLPTAPFDALVAAALVQAGVEAERELDHRGLRALTHAMLERYRTPPPGCTKGQIAPTAGTAVLTASPSRPVRGHRATMENVLSCMSYTVICRSICAAAPASAVPPRSTTTPDVSTAKRSATVSAKATFCSTSSIAVPCDGGLQPFGDFVQQHQAGPGQDGAGD